MSLSSPLARNQMQDNVILIIVVLPQLLSSHSCCLPTLSSNSVLMTVSSGQYDGLIVLRDHNIHNLLPILVALVYNAVGRHSDVSGLP